MQHWRQLTPSARGAWSDLDVGWGRCDRFSDDHLIVRQKFIPTRMCHQLVNLVQFCEGFFGVSPTGSRFDCREIDQIVDRRPIFERPSKIMRLVAEDMRHGGARAAVDLGLSRRYMRATPPEKRRERAQDNTSQWILFLNDDYQGGEIVFPSRHQIVSPRKGTVVRWPSGIPHGITVPHEGYQFALSGRSV